MSSCIRSVVTGVGDYLPARVVTNDDLAKIVDTSDAWIVERTGIRQRRQAADGETTSDLAARAADRALAQAGRTPADVDLIIVGTTTPDLTFPAVATQVQRKLGCPIGIAFDVQAVCSGFVFALATADNFVVRGQSKCALVIGAETMTRLMDWTDRGTCVLFGDGAGAVVLEPREGQGTTADRGVLGVALRADGTKQDLLYVDGDLRRRARPESSVCRAIRCSDTPWSTYPKRSSPRPRLRGVALSEVDWFIPHQANQRILEGVSRRLGIGENRVISTVAEHANTSAASIPLAMARGIADGRIKPGQLLLIEAMGGGLTWGAAVIRL